MRRVMWTFLAASVLGSPSLADDSALPADDPRRDLKISLVLDKQEYFLGENVLVYYRIENRGKATFRDEIESALGDKRFLLSLAGPRNPCGRPRRFHVTLTDSEGRATEDPYPISVLSGGMGGDVTLKPGKEFWENLQLMWYREPGRTGTYTIRVYHDLGWDLTNDPWSSDWCFGNELPKGPHRAPILTATVRLVMPDARQAWQVLEAMRKLPDDPYGFAGWGERSEPFADFAMLRYPIYLPIVKEMAERGDARGLQAIGAMAFPEATAALIELARHKTPKIATQAGELLVDRLPDRYDDPQPPRKSYLASRSWSKDLEARALALGWTLLAGDDCEARIHGGWLIKCLGRKEDLPALIRVMDRLLPAYRNNPTFACEVLTIAAAKLIARGAQPPTMIDTPGNAAAFLVGLKSFKTFRPDGWQDAAESLLAHEILVLREIALESIPLPLRDTAITKVIACLGDQYAPVQGAACELAAKVKSPRFRQPLVEVLRTTSNEWLLRNAFSAATACGEDMDRLLEILVRRLQPGVQPLNLVVLGLVINGTIQDGGSYGARDDIDWQPFLAGMQKAWLDVIAANRQALREGKRFKVGQPPIVRAMFPPEFRFNRAGQPDWPEPEPEGRPAR